jgi:hypothetical protein
MATEQPPPYRAYATIMATFVGGLAGSGALARALDREPFEHTALDLAALALATFKAARTIARDPVTSFIREPLVEDARKGGLEQALAELVTCARCTGRGSRRASAGRRSSRRASAACSRGRSARPG